MIKFGILMVLINNRSRHEVIVQCILFDVEHDERYDTLVRSMIEFGIILPVSEQQFVDMKSSCITASLVLSTTSATSKRPGKEE